MGKITNLVTELYWKDGKPTVKKKKQIDIDNLLGEFQVQIGDLSLRIKSGVAVLCWNPDVQKFNFCLVGIPLFESNEECSEWYLSEEFTLNTQFTPDELIKKLIEFDPERIKKC